MTTVIHTCVNGKANVRMTEETHRGEGAVRNELYVQGYGLNATPQIQIVGTRPAEGTERATNVSKRYRHDEVECVMAGRVMDVHTFVEMFDGLVPGLSVSYATEPVAHIAILPRSKQPHRGVNFVRHPEAVTPIPHITPAVPSCTPVDRGDVIGHVGTMRRRLAERDESIAEAKRVLEANGYTVEKAKDPGLSYVDDLAAFASGVEGTQLTDSDGEQAKLIQLVDASQATSTDPGDVEIYVEIDRALLIAEFERAIAQSEYGPHVSDLWTHLWPVVIRVDEAGDIVLHVTSAERAQFGVVND